MCVVGMSALRALPLCGGPVMRAAMMSVLLLSYPPAPRSTVVRRRRVGGGTPPATRGKCGGLLLVGRATAGAVVSQARLAVVCSRDMGEARGDGCRRCGVCLPLVVRLSGRRPRRLALAPM